MRSCMRAPKNKKGWWVPPFPPTIRACELLSPSAKRKYQALFVMRLFCDWLYIISQIKRTDARRWGTMHPLDRRRRRRQRRRAEVSRRRRRRFAKRPIVTFFWCYDNSHTLTTQTPLINASSQLFCKRWAPWTPVTNTEWPNDGGAERRAGPAGAVPVKAEGRTLSSGGGGGVDWARSSPAASVGVDS